MHAVHAIMKCTVLSCLAAIDGESFSHVVCLTKESHPSTVEQCDNLSTLLRILRTMWQTVGMGTL